MLENFIYAKKKYLFEDELLKGNILPEAIVFIEDTKEIWNHGTYFATGKSVEEIENIVASSETVQMVMEQVVLDTLPVKLETEGIGNKVLHNDGKYKELAFNRTLSFYCIEPVTLIVNSESVEYPANSFVNRLFTDNETFEIVPSTNNSILSLTNFPGALSTFYPWLEGVASFSNILFDMNSEDMYVKWNQNNQGDYHVQKAQYKNCIFWSDLPYINQIDIRTNYTMYNSAELPLCYSNIPENTYKPFYLAYGVSCDPNWANPLYTNSFSLTTNATAPFSYYGAQNVGVFNMAVATIALPKDCRGLMFYSPAMENVGVFDATKTTNFGAKRGSWQEAFGSCYSLKFLYIQNLKASINISWSPIESDSINYIINNAANTSKITISVSPYTWYRLSDSIRTTAAEKNIVLEVIETNSIDDNRLKAIQLNGDGSKFLTDSGTYRSISTSELTNDSNFITSGEIEKFTTWSILE